MFEDVRQHDAVEPGVGERVAQRQFLQVPDDERGEEGPCLLGGVRVEFDTVHGAALRRESLSQVARGTAHVEHGLVPTDELEHERVARVAIARIDRGVVDGHGAPLWIASSAGRASAPPAA
ncbi:hypothetical protein BJF88_06380 [Cellulosimicrobium sp. CUA-896]|nr:hypothetical protein [Cellulosimicrobium sp. CUA-896]OLT55453.1 hypothetical protein BJF88_06380 [Cellulosimicrobium sp. CUA-896]